MVILRVVFFPIKNLVPKGNIVIIQTYSPNVYCENTKYLFEYLSCNTPHQVYWITHHPEIQKHLESKNLKYLCKQRPFQLIWTTLRAKIVIDSGSSFFNFLGLVGKKVVKISTFHGSGPKITTPLGHSLNETLSEVFKMNSFDYVNFASRYASVMIGKQNLKLPHQKVIVFGYPRCDHFFDEQLVASRYRERPVAKMLDSRIGKNDRVILYTPTWRPYEYDFPLALMKDFELQKFHRYLEQSNAYFFYTYHTANKPLSFLPHTDRIQLISHEKFPLFDINQFMLEVDVLLDDYSTTSTDISLLNRPQIFFLPDYEYYFDVKGFIEDYRAIMPGKEVFQYSDFENTLSECFENPNGYVTKFTRQRNELVAKYYDVEKKNSCGEFSDFIGKILRANNQIVSAASPSQFECVLGESLKA